MPKSIALNLEALSKLRRGIVKGWAVPVVLGAGALCIAGAAAYCAACAASATCPKGQHIENYECDSGICGALWASCAFDCVPDPRLRNVQQVPN